MSTIVKDARSFLAAVKMTVPDADYDEGAVEFLESMCEEVRLGLDARVGRSPEKRRQREHWLFFDAFLKGTQFRLKRKKIEAASELASRGYDTEGKATLKITLN